MTNEVGDDPDPLQKLGAAFSVGFVGHVMCEAVDELRVEMNDRFRMIGKLIPYLSGMYYTDQQRRLAEAEIFRLQTELVELSNALRNTLVMAPDLGRPVTVTHT